MTMTTSGFSASLTYHLSINSLDEDNNNIVFAFQILVNEKEMCLNFNMSLISKLFEDFQKRLIKLLKIFHTRLVISYCRSL